jgi:hypothetical protein
MVEREPTRLELQQELEEARLQGRWLSDDERSERLQLQLQQRQQRRKLLILLAVCVLIPPLWPVALGIVLSLLFPRTARRFGLVAGLALLLLGLLLSGLIAAVLVAIVMALF